VVSQMAKELRKGKVFIDWSQNDRVKTTVCVYSLRARARPTVSTPLTWDEVDELQRSGDPERLALTADAVLVRVAEAGDVFAPAVGLEQSLPRPPTS
jgi:bifunctional non-homologous end joining protein LigD